MGPFDVALRTGAEREAFSAAAFLSVTRDLSSPPEFAYLEVLPDARLGILHRLVGSLLREPVEGLPAPVVTRRIDVDLAERFPAVGSVGLEDATPQSLPEECRAVAAVTLSNQGAVLVVPLAGVYGFDRFDPIGRPELHTPDGVRSLSHPLDVTRLLEREGCTRDEEQLARFEAELAESAANLALARLAARVLGRETGAASGSATGSALVEEAFDGTLPGPDPTTFLERIAAIEERPTNPSGKIRRGMSATASFVYAPEFTDRVDLRFVAVEHEAVLRASAREKPPLTDRLFSLFDGLEAAVRRSLPPTADRADHAVLPVHPWQFHHGLPSREVGPGVVPVEGYTVPAAPLLNLRTLVPYTDAGAPDGPVPPHLKLPIDVQKTSSVRTIPPVEIHDGPRLTDALRDIEDREGFGSLGFLYEPAAACYRPAASTRRDRVEGAEWLGALLRQNPYDHRFVGADSLPVTAASLLATPPGAARPLVMALVERFADARGIEDPTTAATGFLEAYLDSVLPGQLRLLSEYGIALDAHLQNACIVFDADGAPTATLFRDFGGIRILVDRLTEQDVGLELAPASPVAAGESMVYRNVLHSTLQTHVGELVRVLVRYTDLDESDCWDVVRGQYRTAFERLRADGDVPETWIASDESALFAETGLHNSRMAMRLQGIPRERAATEVTNPLAAHGTTTGDRP
jgi:siderophore synthetase component